MKSVYKAFLIFAIALPLFSFAPKQDKTDGGKMKVTERDYNNTEIEMADAWRANGKIYVLVATISAVLGGAVFYLVLLDRRVAKMEKEIKK